MQPCKDCKRTMRSYPGSAGYCGKCKPKHKCRVCFGIFDSLDGSWCHECKLVFRHMGHEFRVIANPLPPALAAIRMPILIDRANRKAPLFDPSLSSDEPVASDALTVSYSRFNGAIVYTYTRNADGTLRYSRMTACH